MERIQVDQVTVGVIESSIEHVGWAVRQDSPEWHLIVMRDLAATDPYCLVTEGQATHYEGIDRAAVGRGRTRLYLTSEAAEVLGLPQELELSYTDGLVDPGEVRARLTIVLGFDVQAE